MRDDLPSGTVTFLFTDVEGSTRLLHELGAEGYAEALAEHRRVIRDACAAEGGVEVDTQGDAFFFAFPSAQGALAAACAFTEELAAGPISVRVGLHTGEPLLAEEGYVGADVHLAARVGACGHGGQVLVSPATAALLEDGALLASLGAHRLKDVPEPVSLYQLGGRSFPPLKTLANTNLPTPASSFLGREAELREADELLRSGRLLTITGPGGAGKTRFALELARRALEERFSDYEDGVFACFLASLREPALVLPTLAQTLNVAEQPGSSALEALASHLQGKRMLLLLDNAEHLLESAPELSELVQRAEGLTLLVTSREVLRIQGETPYALPPLPEEEGVALFCERARLEPSPEIAELCARLEGLPLALELAAARTAILTPAQLLARLAQRLDLLKGGRDADPRQATLRATIDWSYELLEPEEQRLLRSLSVFQGGCTLEAAEQVAGADLDSLHSLVDKSLLRFTEERFWMLETIREYAVERLEEAGEPETLRHLHAQWLVRLAARADEGLESSAQQDWLLELEGELSNIRAAHSFLAQVADVDAQLDLVGHLWNFWYMRGGWTEARRWAAPPLAVTRGVRSKRRAHALHADATHAGRLGRYEEAREATLEALEIYEELGDPKGISWQLSALAMLAADDGDLEESRRLYERSAAYARQAGDERTLAFIEGNLTDVALRQGDFLGAMERSVTVQRRFEELGLDQGVYWMLSTQALCSLRTGDLERAARVAITSLTGHIRADLTAVIWDLAILGTCLHAADDAEAAATIVGATTQALESMGLPLTGPEGEIHLALSEGLRRDLGDESYQAAIARGQQMSLDEAVAHAIGLFPHAA